MPIAEATGFAQASSPRRSNPAWARALAHAIEQTLVRCRQLGITDPIEVQARMNAARATLARDYAEHVASLHAVQTAREKQQRGQ